MTTSLFLILLTAFSLVSSLLTEAIKKFFENKKKNAAANVIAAVDAVIVGGAGTAAVYVWMGIAFTASNILALICMMVAVWIGSMIGFDKVTQTLKQIFNKEQ